jgi:surface protein
MKSRNSKSNSGYVGQNRLSDDYGIISENKNYLRSNLTQWIRPTNWLPLPSMTAGDQMFAGLLAIIPPGITAGEPGSTGPSASSNFVAFSMAGCTYTVDWGNGATQSYAAGAIAQYQFLYEGISASTTITGDVGLSGCRQTVITAYPTVAGTTFSGMNFNGVYAQAGYTFSSSVAPSWLDMRIAGSTINSLNFVSDSNRLIRAIRTLRQFEWVGDSAITNCRDMLASASNLRSFKVLPSWSANVTDFNSMFSSCSSLQTVPLFNTANGITFTSMFINCRSLQTVPLFNTANGTRFNNTFNSCTSLQTVPLFNLGKAISVNGIFSGCTSLQTVPLFNTENVTDFGSMFQGCSNLQTVPLFNTATGTAFASMFASCSILQTVPLFNTSKGTTFSNMFNGCSNLQTIPLLDLSKATNISFMFASCSSLQTVPLFNFGVATTVTTPFNNCPNLKQAATQVSILSSGGQWNLSSCNLSPSELNRVFENLPQITSARTCDIAGNWGEPFCNRSIATAKGWNVSPTR